jgi:hypothetical protein
MESAKELVVLKANTERFIQRDPTDIVLIPRTEVWVAGSKRFSNEPPRVSQTFKVIWGGSTGVTTTIDGTTRRFDFVIVGASDATVEIGDHWSTGAGLQDNQVDYVFPFNGYEVKAGGNSYGGKPVA